MSIIIGTSGWSYDHWENIVYPEGTHGKARLDYFLNHFNTVELNSSFYHWPAEKTFFSWYHRLPPGFVMTVKAPRTLTHFQKLYAPEKWIQRISNDAKILKEKLGVILFQFPPGFYFDYVRLKFFLEHWPAEIKAAFEFRNHSWHQEPVFELLEQFNVAYCVMSGINLPCVLKATTGYVYVRLHGSENPDSGGSYTENELQWWAARIHEWRQQNRSVYVYFNNDWNGHAVRNAHRLKDILF